MITFFRMSVFFFYCEGFLSRLIVVVAFVAVTFVVMTAALVTMTFVVVSFMTFSVFAAFAVAVLFR
jgi:hypothetical protein